MAKITVLGAGEAFDSGPGNNSCVLSGMGIPTVLLDCGYQIPERLWACPTLARSLEMICLSHFHADHAFGVLPVLSRYWEEKRSRALWLAGPPGLQAYLKKLFSLGYPGLYGKLGYELRFLETRPGENLGWKGLKFRFARTRHSVRNHSVRIDVQGRSVGFSGDGAMLPEGRELFRGVGLLLQEVYSPKPLISTHFDLQSLRAYVDEAQIGRIGVTHCSRLFRGEIGRKVRSLAARDRRWVFVEPGKRLRL